MMKVMEQLNSQYAKLLNYSKNYSYYYENAASDKMPMNNILLENRIFNIEECLHILEDVIVYLETAFSVYDKYEGFMYPVEIRFEYLDDPYLLFEISKDKYHRLTMRLNTRHFLTWKFAETANSITLRKNVLYSITDYEYDYEYTIYDLYTFMFELLMQHKSMLYILQNE